MKENANKQQAYDLATMITVFGIFMFFLGTLYIKTFYRYLNIPSSLIELDFQRVLTSTWPIVVQIILCFLVSFWWAYERNKNENLLYVNHLFVLLAGSISIVLFNFMLYKYISILAFIVLILMLICLTILVVQKYPKDDQIEKSLYINFIIILIILINIFTYIRNGKKDAESFIKTYEEDIAITLNHDNVVVHGKFVSFMNNKYILLIENDKCHKEPLIINNEEVWHVKFLNIKNE